MSVVATARLPRSVPLPTRPVSASSAGLAALVRQIVATGTGMWLSVDGPSMSPTIRAGDRVLLVDAGAPRRGMVVLVEIGDRTVLHRVTEARGVLVRTRGDGTLLADPLVPRDRVVARAIARERDGRLTALGWAPDLGLLPLARGAWWWARSRALAAVRDRRSEAA